MRPDRGSASQHSYSKAGRLRVRRQYLTVQRHGRRIHLQDFVALVLHQPASIAAMQRELRRVGITVSTKVGNAVRRNRVKRLVREAWRREQHEFPTAIDVVLVAKRHAAQTDHDSVLRQVRQLARKLAKVK